ncbi:hypothetical protein CRI70_31805 [Streptomyces sp. Ru87]|uniref:Uncharacterized protein n=2 Tax=Streptomyces TaxID=1883 RepID=A0ABQ7FN79_9ACTN|nr:hypothetical protein GCU69_05420 [Streptomyces lycii]PGH46848.1 hypothetical protein CRI70_31805 [Streptomyces sp. Ru87]
MDSPGATAHGPEIWVRGPVAPPPRAEVPPPGAEPGAGAGPESAAAPSPVPRAGGPAWVSAHGGAGASTLAAVLGGVDSGNRWSDPARGEPRDVLLVARTHAAGLTALSQWLDLYRRGEHPPGVEILGAVLVADAPGRLPRQLAQRVKVIGSVVNVHRVPWVPTWRTGKLDGPLPREIGALARVLQKHYRPAEEK